MQNSGMASVFGDLGRRISTTIESAGKDLQKTFPKPIWFLSPTDSPTEMHGLATDRHSLFTSVLERSRILRDSIIDRRHPNRN